MNICFYHPIEYFYGFGGVGPSMIHSSLLVPDHLIDSRMTSSHLGVAGHESNI